MFQYKYEENDHNEKWYYISDNNKNLVAEFYYDPHEIEWMFDPHHDCNKTYTIEELEFLLMKLRSLNSTPLNKPIVKHVTKSISDLKDMDGSA